MWFMAEACVGIKITRLICVFIVCVWRKTDISDDVFTSLSS